MSFFTTIFGESKEESITPKLNWIPLIKMGQLDEIIEKSKIKPVAIFKHSTRCSISRMALKQFEKEFNLEDQIESYFLDLLEYRPISNEIAMQFNVFHQSPQIVVIKNGISVYDASHSDIQAEDLKKLV